MSRSTPHSIATNVSLVVRAVVFLFTLLVVILLANRVESRTWHVKADGSGDAPTVQAGVDSAAVGDTVLVAAGAFTDTVHVDVGDQVRAVCAYVDKAIVLMGGGPGNTTLGSSDADVVVYAYRAGPGAVVRDLGLTTGSGAYFCIDANGTPGATDRCGVLCESSVVALFGNEIYANDIGVRLVDSPVEAVGNEIHQSVRAMVLEQASDAVIRENRLHDCGGFIECTESSPKILDNVMEEACEGLTFWKECSPLVSGNRIVGVTNFQAVGVCSYSGATIENNWIAEVDYGIRLYTDWQGGRVIRGNTIFSTQEGIYVHPPDVLVEGNTIDRTIVGVYFASGATYRIRGNIVTRAVWGIHGDSADPPVVECNDVFDATERYHGIADQTGMSGNIAVDPQYCGIDDSGNYYLQSDSPCAQGNHPDGYSCGVIGAWGVNCGEVAARGLSWGALKAMFEKESSRR